MFYIYGLFDPRNGEVFYIGKGTRDRISAHFQAHSRGENIRKDRKIESIIKDGCTPIAIKLIEDLDEESAYSLEGEIIAEYGRIGFEPHGILTNICLDARPPCALGRTMPEETRQKIRDAQRGELNHRYGKKWDDEQKEARRQFNLENGIKPPVQSGPMSEEQKAAIGAGNRGKKRTPEQCARMLESRKGKKRGPYDDSRKEAAAQAMRDANRKLIEGNPDYFKDRARRGVLKRALNKVPLISPN